MDVLLDPVNLLALLTLTLLEIVLGIDNVIFIAIITDSLPPERRNFARRLGLGLALFGRVALVLGVSWLLSLEHPLFTVLDHEITISGLILDRRWPLPALQGRAGDLQHHRAARGGARRGAPARLGGWPA